MTNFLHTRVYIHFFQITLHLCKSTLFLCVFCYNFEQIIFLISPEINYSWVILFIKRDAFQRDRILIPLYILFSSMLLLNLLVRTQEYSHKSNKVAPWGNNFLRILRHCSHRYFLKSILLKEQRFVDFQLPQDIYKDNETSNSSPKANCSLRTDSEAWLSWWCSMESYLITGWQLSSFFLAAILQ